MWDCPPDVAQERAAVISWKLAHGERLTTSQIAALCSTTRQAAWHMMSHLSRILPIHLNDDDQWQEFTENSCGASNRV